MFIFFSVLLRLRKNHTYKSKVHLFSSVFLCLQKKPYYKSKVCLFSSAFFALTTKTYNICNLNIYILEKVKRLDGIQWCVTFKFLHFAIISYFFYFPESKFLLFFFCVYICPYKGKKFRCKYIISVHIISTL